MKTSALLSFVVSILIIGWAVSFKVYLVHLSIVSPLLHSLAAASLYLAGVAGAWLFTGLLLLYLKWFV